MPDNTEEQKHAARPQYELVQEPAEPKAVEQPAEQQPAEQQPAEQQPAEQQPAEQQPAEQQPAEQQPAEQQPAEQQPAEQQPAEQQPAESEKPQKAKKAKNAKEPKIATNAIEFLPDAQEIQQERLSWFARVGVLWIFIIIAAVIAWACFSEVDVIVRAPGKIVSDKGDIIMKPRESAIIKHICVHKGDIVIKDQVLIEFDPSINQAELDRLDREVRVLAAEYERYVAEFEGKAYTPSVPNDPNSQVQQSIYDQRQRYYQQKISYYDTNCKRLEVEKKAAEDSLKKYREILASTQEIESMYEKSYKDGGAVALKELLEAERSRMQVEVEVTRLANQIVEYDQQVLALQSDKNAFIEEWRNSVSEKVVSVGRELDSNRKQLSKAESLSSYVKLTAPCKAVVQDIASFPEGSAVGEAEAIITLVPLDGKLEVEAEVPPQDIARVFRGSTARVKLSAFPFQKHGTLDGHVRMLSANTFTRNNATPNELRPSVYYRASVEVSGKLRNVKDDFTLIPGMEAEVEIKSDKRRIIEYLIHPLIKSLDEAFREP